MVELLARDAKLVVPLNVNVPKFAVEYVGALTNDVAEFVREASNQFVPVPG